MTTASRILIVGINPSSSKKTALCMTLKRLHRWMDELGVRYFSFVNCIGRPGPYSSKDVEYDFLSDCAEGYTKVLALGNFSSEALRKLDIDHFVLPHPSGLNRKLNDREYEMNVLRDCHEYIKA